MSRGVRYRVLRKIAHGGMAEIFLALQIGAEGFEKPVVLKRILPALGSDPAFVRMLVDEAHIVSTLNHTHLVQILDLGQVDDQFFLVLEFVDGWSLEQVRRRARKARLKLPLPLALYITSALCRGLDYVHRRTRNGQPLGIIHRDVTPQNLLLGREGDVKLADFGIAKAIGRREKSATGVIKGKFAYMSPEQTVGGELDARSDLFSVGTLLYLLTTGRKPFEAPTDLDVLMQVRKARHEKPSTFVRDFNPDVERFIERALRADRARRWQSAEQMADKLDSILFEIGKPTGPATLKRWLESLSARDGIAPPGDLLEVSPEPLSGTMQLVSGDLELSHVPPVSSRAHQELLSGAVDQELLPGVWTAARAPAPGAAATPPETDATVANAAAAPESASEAREAATAVVHSDELTEEVPGRASNADDPTVCRPLGTRAATSAGEAGARSEGPTHDTSDEAATAGAAHDTPKEASVACTADLPEEASVAGASSVGEEASVGAASGAEEASVAGGAGAEDEATTAEFALHGLARGGAADRRELASAARSEAFERTTSGQTEPALLLAAPKRAAAPKRPTRWLRRLAVAAVLLPLLLGGGAYVARPYLPDDLMPPGVLRVVDRWLMRLAPTLHSLEGGSSPAAAVEADRQRLDLD